MDWQTVQLENKVASIRTKIAKLNKVRDAARDLLTAIYGMGPPEEIQTYSCYEEIEDLELALTALHDED